MSRQVFKAKEYCAGFIIGRFLINCSSLLCLDHSIGSFVQSAVWTAFSLSKGKRNEGKDFFFSLADYVPLLHIDPV